MAFIRLSTFLYSSRLNSTHPFSSYSLKSLIQIASFSLSISDVMLQQQLSRFNLQSNLPSTHSFILEESTTQYFYPYAT